MTQIIKKSLLTLSAILALTAFSQPTDTNNNPEAFPKGTVLQQSRIETEKVQWTQIQPGIQYAQVSATQDGKEIELVNMLKIDPDMYNFDVHFDYNSKTVEEWQKSLDAEIIVNASYWEPDYTPTNNLVMEGKRFIGQFPSLQESVMKNNKNKRHVGAFVTNPKQEDLAQAKVYSLEERAIDYSNPEWGEVVESYPMLVYEDETVREVQKDKWRANRTVIGTHDDGDISIVTTQKGYFTMREMGEFLNHPQFEIHNALNLDGGIATELLIDTDNLKMVQYGNFETNPEWKIGDIEGKRTIKIPIPSVIGVYKK
jgi:exopolysaccharide biosynthesis protein